MCVLSRCVTASAAAFAAILLVSPTAIAAGMDAEIEKIRVAVERFKDVDVALAEGYIPDPSNHCSTAEDAGLPAALGAMGVHYFRPDLLGITATQPRVNGNGMHTDFENPAVLLYEPQPEGGFELVAVENLVFAKAWGEAGNGAPPTFLGRNWDYMEDDPNTEIDEAHGFEAHYDQHVWVFRDNPNGMLEPFNPAVTCEHHAH